MSNDVEAANEGTALLLDTDESPTTSSSDAPESQRLWEEMDLPWPATFERSISLLASPKINTEEARLFTKSPKPGSTPIARRRRGVSFVLSCRILH